MIVRERPAGFRLFLILRGSVLQRIRVSLAINTLLAILVTLAHGSLFSVKITLTPIPFTLIGLPLAIFLGFRNNTAYDRYWEGRKLWGELVIQTRTLARQCLGLIDLPQPVDSAQRDRDVRVRMIHRAIAYAHALRLQLRDQASPEVQRWVTAQEWQALERKPVGKRADALMLAMGQELGGCVRRGEIDACLAARMDGTLTGMVAAAASCERIRHTPMPFSYALLLHRTAYMYCFLLPFGLVDITGFMTPFVVAIVAYTFFGLGALGDDLEEPFGMESNDLPLDTICRGTGITLLEALNAPDIPEPLRPVNYLLT